MQKHSLKYGERFDFEAGGSLPGIEIVYHTSPREYKAGDKVVWICHALTANSDAEDWWPEMVGPGKLFDTDRFFVVCVNELASPYGSSGPASEDPDSGRPYFFSFPRVTVRDVARTFEIVRQHLGIQSVDLLVGSSIGGFHALEWSIMAPDVISTAAFMATSPRVSPYLSAFEESQRMALEADPTFREAKDLKGGEAGLRCARAIAMLSYRSRDGYVLTQHDADPDTMFAARAGSYQRHQGKKLADRFDAYSYYYLADAVDSQNVGRGRGGEEAALSLVKARTVVVSIDSDCIFPPEEVRRIADAVAGADYYQITSRFGHDGFLLEAEQLSEILGKYI